MIRTGSRWTDIFTSAAVNWMVFPEGVDLFDKHSLTLDGGLEEPLPR